MSWFPLRIVFPCGLCFTNSSIVYNLKCSSVHTWLIAWELNGVELIEFKTVLLWYYRNMSIIHPLCLSFMSWAIIFSMQLRSLLQTLVFWWNRMKGMDLDLSSLTGSVCSPVSDSLLLWSAFSKDGCDTSLKLIMWWCLLQLKISTHRHWKSKFRRFDFLYGWSWSWTDQRCCKVACKNTWSDHLWIWCCRAYSI